MISKKPHMRTSKTIQKTLFQYSYDIERSCNGAPMVYRGYWRNARPGQVIPRGGGWSPKIRFLRIFKTFSDYFWSEIGDLLTCFGTFGDVQNVFEPSKTNFEVTVSLERYFKKGEDRDFQALYRGGRDDNKKSIF